MTEQEERFLHFVASVDDLNESLSILELVQSSQPSLLATAAFRFALVKYSAPYRTSRGRVVEGMKLADTFVPIEHRALHQRIVSARDQVHVHTDLTIKDAVLHVSEIAGHKFALPIQNLITGTEELPNIEQIISLIRQTLDKMLPEMIRLEEALPPTSTNEGEA